MRKEMFYKITETFHIIYFKRYLHASIASIISFGVGLGSSQIWGLINWINLLYLIFVDIL